MIMQPNRSRSVNRWFRGRGLFPSLMRHVMHEALAAGGHAYIDCRVYNTPALRSVAKAGFVGIATMRPISRGDALPGDS